MAAIISAEGILGLVSKTHIPDDREFYEKRWFASSTDLSAFSVEIDGEEVPVSTNGMIFRTPFGNFGIEICEDLWNAQSSLLNLGIAGSGYSVQSLSQQ